jgi:hypothetical protein
MVGGKCVMNTEMVAGLLIYAEAIYYSDRVWGCKKCGTMLERDINAAINIKREGCRILGIEEMKHIEPLDKWG